MQDVNKLNEEANISYATKRLKDNSQIVKTMQSMVYAAFKKKMLKKAGENKSYLTSFKG